MQVLSRRFVGDWMEFLWQLNWPPRVLRSCLWKRLLHVWMTAFHYLLWGAVQLSRATRRCAPPLTGVTTCSRSLSKSYYEDFLSSQADSPSKRQKWFAKRE